MTINNEMIERAAQIYKDTQIFFSLPLAATKGLHAALRKADPNWDEGLSFDEVVSALIAVERRARELLLQEGE
jgi:hypothetical protein